MKVNKGHTTGKGRPLRIREDKPQRHHRRLVSLGDDSRNASKSTERESSVGTDQTGKSVPSILDVTPRRSSQDVPPTKSNKTRQVENTPTGADDVKTSTSAPSVPAKKAQPTTRMPKAKVIADRGIQDSTKAINPRIEPTDREKSDRKAALDRLAQGGYISHSTKTKSVLDSPILPPKDIGAIKRKLRIRNLLPNIIIAICLLVIFVGISGIVIHLNDLKRDNEELSHIANTYTTVEGGDTTYLPPAVDWNSLKQVNEEISGWIYIPGTNVNYPVLSSSTPEKYLRLDIYNQYKISGSIFTDWSNSPDYSDNHVIIYGHHLPSNTMFTPVSEYVTGTDEYMRDHSLIYLETPETTYELMVIGSYQVQPDEIDAVNTSFDSDNSFQRYLDERIAKCTTVNQNAIDRRIADKLFTLITCTNSGTARAVVEAVPVSAYPTSYVPNIRKSAGARVTEIHANPEEIKQSTASPEKPNNPYVEWVQDIMLRLSDLDIPFLSS